MKVLLTFIVLLYGQQYAFADMTLKFNELISKKHITFKIKNGQLKFFETDKAQFNQYKRDTQQFMSVDTATGKKALITQALLKQRVKQLNQQRLTKLAQVELKLKNELKSMSDKDRETAESLVNFLKYPDIYGEQTHLSIKKANISKQIHNINCQVYQLFRKKNRIKEVCIAQAKSLNLTNDDYKTLRSFYQFNYNMQTQLMLAMGKTRFNLIDYAKHNISGLMIESIDYKGTKITQHLILNSTNTRKLANF